MNNATAAFAAESNLDRAAKQGFDAGRQGKFTPPWEVAKDDTVLAAWQIGNRLARQSVQVPKQS